MIYNVLPHEPWYLEWRDISHIRKLVNARRGRLSRPCLRVLMASIEHGTDIEIMPSEVLKCFFESTELAWRLLQFEDIDDVKELCHSVLDAAKMYKETTFNERKETIERHDYFDVEPLG